MGPGTFFIGEHSHVNPDCLIDYRGGVEIGSSVSISHRVMLITGGHGVQSKSFSEIHKPIKIGDHVCLGFNVQLELTHKQIALRVDNINVVRNDYHAFAHRAEHGFKERELVREAFILPAYAFRVKLVDVLRDLVEKSAHCAKMLH